MVFFLALLTLALLVGLIPNSGKSRLLNYQLSSLANCYWGLFTSNTTISDSTVWSSLTEAAWGGYARVLAGSWGAPAIVTNQAVSVPASSPSFGNTSGSTQTFYGWFLLDTSDNTLIAAVNLGSTTIANAAVYPLAAAITDNDVAG